jgi:hypothetical protein
MIEVTPIRDPGTTGNFEVSIGRDSNSMKLIHSKANGKGKVGKCDSSAELDGVVNAIETQFHFERHEVLKAASAKPKPASPPPQFRRK